MESRNGLTFNTVALPAGGARGSIESLRDAYVKETTMARLASPIENLKEHYDVL
jgi:hypothetical protein